MAMSFSYLTLYWWHFSPYFNHSASIASNGPGTSWNTDVFGIFPEILHNAFEVCGVTGAANSNRTLPVTSRQLSNPGQFEDPALYPDNTTLYLLSPFTTNDDEESFLYIPKPDINVRSEFVPLVESPGSVHFYKSPEQPVGNDLLKVILQGWPMLVLILLGAAYSGIIIWLLDRLWNPSNFPKPFIRGFWEGFWWAFVTMTTVGYGDTTPRSFQARIYGLVWIVVGITILSVFTATVTTVLTQESLGQHYSIFGNEVGLVNGTEDYRLVIKNGGRPVVSEEFDGILQNAREHSIQSAVYDQFAFATEQDKLQGEFLVEKIVENPVRHGVLLVGPEGDVRSCLVKELRAQKSSAFREMMQKISPYTTRTTSAADHAQDLFQPMTITYMWYGLALWLSIFIAFVLWEFLYWRPKHRKRKEMKRQMNLERGIYSYDNNSTNSESESPSSCFPKRPSTYSKKQMQAMKNTSDSDKNPSQNQLKIDEFLTPEAPQKGDKTKQGQRSPTINNRKKELIEVGDLESLIRRQKEELDVFDEELNLYKIKWENKMKDLKRLHREERRKLLRLMDHDGSIWNETKNTGNDIPKVKFKVFSGDDSVVSLPTVTKNTKLTNHANNVLSGGGGGALPFDEPVSSI